MYKSDPELEQGWVRTPRTHPLDMRLNIMAIYFMPFKNVFNNMLLGLLVEVCYNLLGLYSAIV